ncbi:hypothetical protein AY601_1664 [Pedobacter cryoconitis]|uniref:Carboxypeptidase-like protein n=1 Tax=Pedobacter cryoconitis TaxID=188932 RepID=A0A127VBI6_9SPHI|nr:carboxypeptidase-like regulatory domain-containing protein [Pedobacter cryoconitis]AMP98579.1 hypothetical protein AY601_1664 [Pedobacter cryoconitis]
MNKLIIIIAVVSLSVKTIYAQNLQEAGGIVVDEHQKTLPYVSLKIGKQIAAMTNADGEFLLKYSDAKHKDSLIISYIGYKNLKFSLSELHKDMKIQLIPSVVNLKEITIRPVSAESIIRQAIKNIPENYDTRPFEMKGFYREIGKVDTSYLSFAEASLNILSQGYKENSGKDKIVINKERNLKKLGEREVNNPLNMTIDGAPYSIIANDMAKNPVRILGKNYFKKYKFEIAGSVMNNGEEAYLITFDQQDKLKEALYKGKMVILKSSYAIVSTDFALSPKGITYAKPDISFITRPVYSLLGYNFRKLNEEFSERYVKINDKWYPYFYKISAVHHLKAKYKHLEGTLAVNAELFISKINIPAQGNYDKIMPGNYVFKNYVTTYKDDYWGDYNFIKPTNSLKELAEKLQTN